MIELLDSSSSIFQKNPYSDLAKATRMSIEEQLKPFLNNLENSPITSNLIAVLLYGKHLRLNLYSKRFIELNMNSSRTKVALKSTPKIERPN